MRMVGVVRYDRVRLNWSDNLVVAGVFCDEEI
jgi:hypothetical protein